MNLPTASAVGFAVSEGFPTDARDWIAVDFDGHLTSTKRGYLIATEPTTWSVVGRERATQVRDLVMNELRRQHQVEPGIALGRALARANSFVVNELRSGESASFEHRIFIGVTACIIENHTLTVAHVPPGQMVMVEDGLTYAVPELGSWLPDYAGNGQAPEPLGYSHRVKPHLAVTELRPGDVFIITTSQCGAAVAERVAADGEFPGGMSRMFGRDPDLVLDYFRAVILDSGIETASVAVLALPPVPGSLQIRTMADVGRRLRDQTRHARGVIGIFNPLPGTRKDAHPFSSRPHHEPGASGQPIKPLASMPEYSISSASSERSPELPPEIAGSLTAKPDPVRATRLAKIQRRVLGMAERGTPKWVNTWRQPTEMHRFGVPGAHGVQIFRGNRSLMGDPSWKNYLPRLPLISAGLLWILLFGILILGVVGGAFVLDRMENREKNYDATFMQIDQQIVTALAIVDPEAKSQALEVATTMIGAARTAGAPEHELQSRELTIASEQDGLENIIRVSDVQRLGSLPPELRQHPGRIVHTAVGVFIVSGSLYQLHPETGELEKVLVEGSVVDSAAVRSLFGIGFDAEGLYVTDGIHLFVLTASNEWTATEMQEINQLGAWQPGPTDAFGGNVYVLEPEYRNIYWFESNPENGVAVPVEWVSRGDRSSLNTAVDMTIDGNIYVLQEDGRVQRFYLGNLASEFTPEYLGSGKPVAILNGVNTGLLYVGVSEGTSGRVLVMGTDGRNPWQLKLPAGFDAGTDEVMQPFENVQDIAVDEATGTLYVMNGDGIWSMRYSLPGGEESPATPTPEG